MKVLVLVLLVLVQLTLAQEEAICDVSPEGTTVDPTSQNKVDEIIQRFQGKRSTIFLRKYIVRQIKDPNSRLRQWAGRMLQDPREEDEFEEGDAGVTAPVPSKFVDLVSKIFGETRTVVGYLRTFGFFAKVLNKSPNQMENFNGAIPPCAITNAIKEFQVFNQLPADGVLTKETRRLMALDRCGNPDVECDTDACKQDAEENNPDDYLKRRRRAAAASEEDTMYLSRRKRYSITRAMKTKDIKYYYYSYTDDMSVEAQRDAVERGFKVWSDVTPLTFTEVDNEDDANFYIDFGEETHGDKYSFDGPLGVLAHGFYPRKGQLHFDDAEYFTAREYSGINLYYVTAHEVGHALGIKHSTVRSALMAPYYPGYSPVIQLADDDVGAIHALYGSGEGGVYPLSSHSSTGSGSGSYVDSGDGPGPDNLEIAPTEEEGPDNIEFLAPEEEEEAVVVEEEEEMEEEEEEGEEGEEMMKEEMGEEMMEEEMGEEMGDAGCITRIDGAFNHPTEKYAYVLTGNNYIRLEADDRNMPVVSEGYPKDISSEWPGVEGAVDAAFTDYHRQKTFFFKGDMVYCWDWESETMEIQGGAINETEFAGLPSGIRGVASYRDYVIFIYTDTYYLWTADDGLIPDAQEWPYQGSDQRNVHVSGAFDAFLRGYFYTANSHHPEKYVLFKSSGLLAEDDSAIVENYFYRKWEEDMNLDICEEV